MVKTHSAANRVLSVFLCAVMCLTSFVFFAPKAEATVNAPNYASADKYGTQPWNGTAGKAYFQWNNGSDDYWKVEFPRNIYLDISETLQSAGYYQNYTWHFGDSSNYRTIFLGSLWGEGLNGNWTASNQANMNGMMNAFNGYSHDFSLSTSGKIWGVDVSSGTDFDLKQDDAWDGQRAVIIRWSKGTMNEKNYLKGTPKATGTYTFNTSGWNPLFIVNQKYETSWGRGSWNAKTQINKNSSPYSTDCYIGSDREIEMIVTIYDKSSLKTQINNAASVINNNSAYTSLISAGNWSTLTSRKSTADTNIKTREITQDTLNTTANNLQSAYTALKFKAKDDALKASIKTAEDLIASTDYALNYTEATRNALASALANAKNYTLTEYSITTSDFTAGQKANAQQTDLNNKKTALDNALSAMGKTPADFSAFNEHAPLEYGTCYTADSLKTFNDAVAAVKALQTQGLTRLDNQPQVDTAIAAVETAFAGLVAEHHYNEDVFEIVKDSSCTEEGSKTLTCLCGNATKTETIEKKEHTPADYETVAPGCVTDGHHGGTYCSVCKNELTAWTVDSALGHAWGDWETVTNATCVKDGEKVRTCTREGCNAEEREPIAADPVNGHNFSSDYTVDRESTCTVEGWESRHCLNEGCTATTDGRAVALKEHQYTVLTDDVKASTCRTLGYEVYKCANCDATNKVVLALDPDNHTPGEWEVKTEAKCGVAGEEVKYCQECGVQTDSKEIPPLSHIKSEEWETEIEPTCIKEGKRVRKCTLCGEVMEFEIIGMTEHTYSDTAADSKASTCITKGYDIYPCTTDGCNAAKKVDRAFDPANHESTETKLINQKDATCKEDGYTGDTVHSCCEAVITNGTTISKDTVEHTWDGGKVTKEPTYTEKGEMTYTCTVCGKTRTEEIDLAAHTCSGGTATCVSRAVCVICNKEYGELDPANHTGTTHIENAKTATCKEDGYTGDVICDSCSNVKTPGEVIAKETVAHQGGTATCKTLAVCSVCGNSYGELNPANHESTETHIVNAKTATCKEDGYTGDEVYDCCSAVKTQGEVIAKETVAHQGGTATCKTLAVCSVCGNSYGELNPANHESAQTAVVNTKTATCKEDGYTGDTVMECCGALVSAGSVISKDTVAHTAGEWTVTVPASCGITGHRVLKCAVCSAVIKEEDIEALTHNFSEWKVTKKATCKATGTETRTCSICKVTETREIPLAGHTASDWVVKEYANCSKTGIEVKRCTVCGTELESRVIPVSDHSFGEWQKIQEADCTREGLTQRICSGCGKIETQVTPALGHTLDNGVVIKPATFDEKGIIRHTCTVCGVTFDKELPAIVHTHEGGVATCTKKAVCTICGQSYGEYDNTNHGKVVPVPAVLPSCTQAGHGEGTQCADCGNYIEVPVVIPAKGHIDEDGDEYCDICGASTRVVYTWETFRCKSCDKYDVLKKQPVIGWIYAIVHFFIHLVQYIQYLVRV